MIGLHAMHLNYHKDGLNALFVSSMVRFIAISMLNLFSAIYIYTSFVDFGHSKGAAFTVVCIFYIVHILSKLAALFFSENLSQKLGFKGTVWVSSLPFILFIISIFLAASMPIFFIIAAIFWGMHSGLYWWGYHGYFIKTANKKHFGASIGKANLLYTLVKVLSPALGAFIITYLGFNYLYVAASIFLASSLVLFGIKNDKRQKRNIRASDAWKLVRAHRLMNLAYAGDGGELHLYIVAWPLVIFLFFGEVLDLGIIISVAALLSAVFAVFIGRYTDKHGEKKLVSIGAPLLAISWLIRLFANIPAYVFADSLRDFSTKLVALPLNELSYKKALEGGTSAAILFREIGLTVGSVFALVLAILFVNVGFSLSSLFVVAAMFSLFPLAIIIFKKL